MARQPPSAQLQASRHVNSLHLRRLHGTARTPQCCVSFLGKLLPAGLLPLHTHPEALSPCLASASRAWWPSDGAATAGCPPFNAASTRPCWCSYTTCQWWVPVNTRMNTHMMADLVSVDAVRVLAGSRSKELLDGNRVLSCLDSCQASNEQQVKVVLVSPRLASCSQQSSQALDRRRERERAAVSVYRVETAGGHLHLGMFALLWLHRHLAALVWRV